MGSLPHSSQNGQSLPNLDDECLDAVDFDLNNAIFWYLAYRYADEELEQKILSDSIYDRLVRKIVMHWQEIDTEGKKYVALTNNQLTLVEFPVRMKHMIRTLKECYDVDATGKRNP